MGGRRCLVLVVVMSCLGLTACAQDVGLIDRTQPGLLPKAMFDGDWFMRRTVIDAPYDTGYTFIGEQDEVRRVRWELQEGLLIAWRVHPHVKGTQDAAPEAVFAIEDHVDVIREYNASTGEQTNVQVENTEDRPWYDRDYVRVDWSRNQVTNFNFWVEQLDQDPVAYFVEAAGDPDRLLLGVRQVDGSWNDIQDAAALRGATDAQYLDVVTKVFVKPEQFLWEDPWGDLYYEPACWTYGNYDCSPGVVTVRNSFLRVAAALSDYEPLDFPDNELVRDADGKPVRVIWNGEGNRAPVDEVSGTETGEGIPGRGNPDAAPSNPYATDDSTYVRLDHFDKFGYFRTERHGYDPQYGEVESDRTFLINRWNIWDVTHQPDGTPIPYAQRTVRPIVYYLSPDFPESLRVSAQLVASQWNDAFRQTVASLTGKPASGIEDVFIIRDNSRQVDSSTGEVLVRGEVNGDLRYSHLWLVDQPTRVGLLGYGPSAADPLTGEIFAADAYVYGAAVLEYAAHGRDIIDLINGRLDPEELALGEHIKSYLASLGAGGSKKKARSKEAYRAFARSHRQKGASSGGPGGVPKKMTKKAPKPSLSKVLAKPGIEKLRRPAGWMDAQLARVQGTGLEDLLMSDPAIIGMKSMGMVDPHTPVSLVSPAMRQRMSPVNWASPHHHRKTLERFRSFAKRNMMMAAFFDDAVAGLAMALKDKPSDEIVDAMMGSIFKSTAEHEVGHTLGLRHNFEGTTDALNYHPEFWTLKGMEPEGLVSMSQTEINGRLREYQYSSIMDYAGRFNTDTAGLGRYDVAAIKFGYGQLVEVFPEEPYEPLIWLEEVADGVFDRQFTLEEVLRKWRHYTSIPFMFDDVAGIGDRIDVPYTREVGKLMGSPTGANSLEAQLVGEAPWVHTEVPYQFCSDEYVFGTATCNAFDTGADAWEIVADAVERYRNYYWFNNFKRDRVFFDEWDYMDSLWWRYFVPVKTMHDQWVLGQWFDTDTWEWIRYWADWYEVPDLDWDEAMDGGLAFSAAAMEGMAFMQEVLAMPAPGAYMYDMDEDYWWAIDAASLPLCEGEWSFESEDWCADFNLGLGPARYFESIYDVDSGYYFYERVKWIGSFYDKLLALETISSPDAYFLGVDTSASLDQWAISMYASFPEELQTVFTGIAADQFELFAGTFDGDGTYVAPDPYGSSGLRDLMAEQGPVDPQTSFTVQLYALWFGMSWLNANFDNTFNDFAKIWLEGSGEAFEPAITDPAMLVTFDDPFNLRTYASVRSPDEKRPGTGAAMLDEAQRWKTLWQNEMAAHDGDPGIIDYYKWRVTNMVENIETVRGMYDLYGYIYF